VKAPIISIAGTALTPDASGALYWDAGAALIVADLHLEKGSSHARRGIFLPPYDSRCTLERLKRLCDKYRPKRVIALGDSFHDPDGPARLPEAERALVMALTTRHEFIWIAGNHDGVSPALLGGTVAESFRLGPLLFRHLPKPGAPDGEIAGHLHPCARVAVRGRHLRRRCFVGDGARLVLPAFGAFTGGLDLFDRAFDGLFLNRITAFLLGENAVYAFPERHLAR
jgi:DNA ligase-associated metallophosphoesterase